jgi:hypothetical protein
MDSPSRLSSLEFAAGCDAAFVEELAGGVKDRSLELNLPELGFPGVSPPRVAAP